MSKIDGDLTSLDLFLLALIGEGFDTPYALHHKVGLSVGATVPALGRLEKRGLLQRGEKGPRRKRRFALTSEGAQTVVAIVQQEAAKACDKPPRDLESISRLVAIILKYAILAAPEYARSILRAATKNSIAAARDAKDQLGKMPRKDQFGTARETYQWVMAEWQVARHFAEIRTFRKIRSSIVVAPPRTFKKLRYQSRRSPR